MKSPFAIRLAAARQVKPVQRRFAIPAIHLTASTGTCTYSPIASQPTVAGCPQGYNLIDRGGQKVCAIGQNLNGQCPAYTYFDSQSGACVSATGSADVPYGLNNHRLLRNPIRVVPQVIPMIPIISAVRQILAGRIRVVRSVLHLIPPRRPVFPVRCD